MKFNYLILLVLFTSFLGSPKALAKMVGEKCKWKVAYDADGFPREDLPRSKIVGEGFNKIGTSANKAKNNSFKRYHLSFLAVKLCLEASLNKANPKACSKSKKKIPGGKYRVAEWNLNRQPLKKTVFNALCNTKKLTDPDSSGKISGINIYAVYDGKDPLCEVDKGKKKGIDVIAKGLSVNCDDGSAGKENKKYKDRVSKWYKESAGKVKKKVKNFCHKKFGMKGKPKFGDFEINKKSGEIRVNYSCRN